MGLINKIYTISCTNQVYDQRSNGNKKTDTQAGPMRAYQDRWWKKYNPKYKGNDCANYVSQVLHSGGAPFRKSGQFKWFPYDYGWINVIGLRDFLLNNTIKGPFGKKTNKLSKLTCGDLIVWRNKHAITVYKGGSSNPIITSHTAHYKGTLKKKYGTSNLTKIMVLEYYY